MAAIAFLDPATGTNFNGSGIGFFGVSFGGSILVANFNQTSFLTDANGVTNIMQLNNVQFLNVGSGIVGSSTSGIAVTCIPNFQSSLRISFTNGAAVKTQVPQLVIYDRTNINNPASGVTTKVYECIHPPVAQTNVGSGATSWTPTVANGQTGTLTVGGSGIVVNLTASPGTSGFRPNGAGTTDTQHDWYVCLSASPDTVGVKNLYGLYFSTQYL